MEGSMMKPKLPSADKVIGIAVGLICCGIGLCFGTYVRSDAGDVLAFAGGLIGAGASVWGAFAVVGAKAASDERLALESLKNVAEDVVDEMSFLHNVRNGTAEQNSPEEISRRIDSTLLTVPRISTFVSRLSTSISDIQYIGVSMRLSAALDLASPEFDKAIAERRDGSAQMVDDENVSVALKPIVIENLRRTAAQALADLNR
jgi:hypothetical protein